MNLLGGALSGQLGSISTQVGATPEQTQRAVGAALPALVGALARNAGSPGGAQALAGALDRDHDGALLDGLGGLLSGAGPQTGVGGLLEMAGSMLGAAPGPGSARTTNGDGILSHVLGDKRGAVERGIAQASGLDASKAAHVLSLLAPLVMAALGKAKRGQGLDAGGLGELLGRERAGLEPSGAGDLLGGLLDRDDDGSIADDLVKVAGKNLLGGLFG
ncbi:MAG: DUF937 domain-containing protein [Myxococcota bacterium]|nr:DUF937 domain-containing protein [Myxococcota bacterium]